MKKAGTRRGVRALVLLGIVGVVTLGLATQAMACICIQIPPAFEGANTKTQGGNNTLTVTGLTIASNEAVVATLVTGTFPGDPVCSDNTGPGGYTNVINQNIGTSGRMVVCVKPAGHAAVTSVTATYTGFGGTSVMDVVSIPNVGLPIAHNQDFDSNPPVDSGSVINVPSGSLLFGVVFNTNISNFTPDPGWLPVGVAQSGGSGSLRRNITPVYMFASGPPADYAVTGTLTGSGFWQAAILQFAQICI